MDMETDKLARVTWCISIEFCVVSVELAAMGASTCGALSDAMRSILPGLTHQEQLLAMLQTLDACLGDANVPYWVTGGTLLGAVRHRGIVPHDDDIDVEILKADMPRALDALGAIGRSYRDGGFWTGVEMGRFFFWGTDPRFTMSVDVFWRTSLEALEEFPSHGEIFPLHRRPFHNITVPVPCHAQAFLMRCYGETCLSEVRPVSLGFVCLFFPVTSSRVMS